MFSFDPLKTSEKMFSGVLKEKIGEKNVNRSLLN